MKKILLILLLAGPLGIVFQACSPCNCPPALAYYKIDKTYFSAYKIVKKPTEELLPLAPNSMVKADSLALNVQFTQSYYSKAPSSFSFGLINTALACKCVQDGYKGTTEKILNISIITLKDFNPNFTAGSDVTNIATINKLSVNNFIQNWNSGVRDPSNLTLIDFTEKMATEAQQQLEFRIETNMGTFSASTFTFIVIP